MVKFLFSFFLTSYLAIVFGYTVKNFPSISWPDYFTVVIPSVLVVIIALVDIVLGSEAGWLIRQPSYLLVSNALILNAPSSFDRPGRYIVCSSVALAISLIWLVSGIVGFRYLSESPAVPLGIPALILVQNLINRRNNGTVASFDLSLLLDLAAAVVLCVFDMESDVVTWVILLLSLFLFALLLYLSKKKYLGICPLCPISKDRIQPAERPVEVTAESIRMDGLYERLEKYMKEEEPFLNDELTIAELAQAMFTNKTYLSRTINLKSGKNFCTYVNEYRIKYSVEIMKKDHRVKVVELAVVSGFHTVASFNMAFRLFMGDTPSEYMRTLKAEELRHH